MTIILDGTNGITSPNDTTGNQSYTGTLTGGTGVVNLGSGQFYKDASGNIGIGVTPSAWASFKPLQIGSQMSLWSPTSGNGSVFYSQNLYFNGANRIALTTGTATEYIQDVNGNHIWFNAPSVSAGSALTMAERMRIDSSGNLLVGTTSVLSNGLISASFNPASKQGMTLQNSAGTNSTYIGFNNSSGSQIGYISGNGTVTAYNVTSDRRLKENIIPLTNGLKNILDLKPSKYNYISDSSNVIAGFIADELQTIVPNAVTGQPNAVGKDGKPVYQGVDSSFLIPYLVSAIQELKAEIDLLKGK